MEVMVMPALALSVKITQRDSVSLARCRPPARFPVKSVSLMRSVSLIPELSLRLPAPPSRSLYPEKNAIQCLDKSATQSPAKCVTLSPGRCATQFTNRFPERSALTLKLKL